MMCIETNLILFSEQVQYHLAECWGECLLNDDIKNLINSVPVYSDNGKYLFIVKRTLIGITLYRFQIFA